MQIASYLKSRVSVVQVIEQHCEIKKRGRDLVCLCLFHRDRSPSMSINPDKNTWRCWACGISGDQISFIRRLNNCSFLEAAKYLINTFNIPPPIAVYRRLIREQIRLFEKQGDLAAAKELARQL